MDPVQPFSGPDNGAGLLIYCDKTVSPYVPENSIFSKSLVSLGHLPLAFFTIGNAGTR